MLPERGHANDSGSGVALVAELGAASGVQWLGGCKDMRRCLSEADIAWLPTDYREGVLKVLLEACAAGRVIVTTDIPGSRDVVRAGENGRLVPPQDVAASAAAIRRLPGDPPLGLAWGWQVVRGPRPSRSRKRWCSPRSRFTAS
jgi:glycosyltransferase involved in cell wall biosynthesis